MFEKKNLKKWRLVEELHAPARKNFPRRRVIIYGYDDFGRQMWSKRDSYTRFNKDYYYILTFIDVLSMHTAQNKEWK